MSLNMSMRNVVTAELVVPAAGEVFIHVTDGDGNRMNLFLGSPTAHTRHAKLARVGRLLSGLNKGYSEAVADPDFEVGS